MMKITEDICKACKYSTTDFPIKALGIETLRCTICGCFIKLKAKFAPECPKFKNTEEYLKDNGLV